MCRKHDTKNAPAPQIGSSGVHYHTLCCNKTQAVLNGLVEGARAAWALEKGSRHSPWESLPLAVMVRSRGPPTETCATACTWCRLQRKDPPHSTAKGTTEEVFGGSMCILSSTAARHWCDFSKKPMFCYDSAAIQATEHHWRTGCAYHVRIVTPSHSSDFCKPIHHENCHIKDRLMQQLYACVEHVTAQLVQDWILDRWLNDISTESMAADVRSLKKTCQAGNTPKSVEYHHMTPQRLLAAMVILLQHLSGDSSPMLLQGLLLPNSGFDSLLCLA